MVMVRNRNRLTNRVRVRFVGLGLKIGSRVPLVIYYSPAQEFRLLLQHLHRYYTARARMRV